MSATDPTASSVPHRPDVVQRSLSFAPPDGWLHGPPDPTAATVGLRDWPESTDNGALRGRHTVPAELARATAGARTALPATAGGVVTWLPEGRWAVPDDGRSPDEPPEATFDGAGPTDGARAPGDREAASRRRARRLVAGTRVVARLAGWPRRVLAAALLLAAVVVAIRPDRPSGPLTPPPPGVAVVVAARDLPAGAVLSPSHLRTAALPAGAVPAGTAREVRTLTGRTVAGPVRRGEPITDVRLVGPGLTAGLGPQESSAVPVRLADPEAASLVRAGDRVDVLGTPVETDAAGAARDSDAVEVAAGVRVLAVLRGGEAADGVVLVVAAEPAVARRLAGAAARQRLTVTVRPP